MKNLDTKTIESFGDEWTQFDQSDLSNKEAYDIFKNYFSIFPLSKLLKTYYPMHLNSQKKDPFLYILIR